MLDPISAIGLAGNIVQFVDFSWGLLRETKDLYNSSEGTTADIDVLERISNDIININDTLTAPSAADAIPDQMRDLASQCKRIAQELLEILDKVKAKEPRKKWRSFVAALRSVWKKKQIEDLVRRLERLRDQMQSRLQRMLFERNSDIQRTIEKLVVEYRNLNVDEMQGIERKYLAVQEALTQLQSEAKLQSTTLQATYKAIRRDDPVEAPTTPAWVDDMKDLCLKLSSLAREVGSTASDQMLLRSLHFKDIRTRETQVASSHKETFQWLLDSHSPTNVTQWLESQSGMFWVTGKPGSGKSTLMKFLVAHSRTMKLLRSWAGTRRLITASFYFWNAGNTIQKSQEGLFRSLLYNILCQYPNLIRIVCTAKSATFRPFENEVEPWTLQELQQAIEQLHGHFEVQAQFCFFIDGLDEYDGHPDDIVKVLESLRTVSNIKLCVSSRPWNEFLDAFGQDSSRHLALEKLTRKDIEDYIRDNLEANSNFAVLKQTDARSQDLIDEIVEKASGVFLWVVLVVRSLLNGLRNADRIPDLQRRLHGFPETLEKFFRHMFVSIEETYREQTAQAFTYVLAAASISADKISLITFSFLDEEDLDGCIFTTKSRNLTNKDMSARKNDMRRRLNGRSKGLLEVLEVHSGNAMLKPKVDFLHRTLYDFLATKDMQSMLASNLKPDFEPMELLCKAYAAQLNAIHHDPLRLENEVCVELLEDMLFYARAIELRHGVSPLKLLDQAEALFRDSHNKAGSKVEFLAFLIKRELYLYITTVLQRKPQLEPQISSALLERALKSSETKYFGAAGFDLRMIGILLEHGAPPQKAWHHLVHSIHNNANNKYNEKHLQVVELMLRHGADPRYRIATKERTVASQIKRKKTWRAVDLLKQSIAGRVERLSASALEIVASRFGEEEAERVFRQAGAAKKPFLSKMKFWLSGYILKFWQPSEWITAWLALEPFSLQTPQSASEQIIASRQTRLTC